MAAADPPNSAKPAGLSRCRTLGLTLLALLVWGGGVAAVALLRQERITASGPGSAAMIEAAKQQSSKHSGNLAMVVLDKGRVAGTHFMSIGPPVDADTLFQMASVSKWVTAWGVLTLVEARKIDLDAPVSHYLTRWQLPKTGFDNDQVTVRRLLSHTAGLTDGLGYCGFAPGQPLQPLPASLTAAADACPLTGGAVAVGAKPGEWQYSGGGYSLLQLVIEDVSGRPFADYMEAAVLTPLGMRRSTFRTRAGGTPNTAAFFDSDGSPAPHNAYTAAAAASLYASAADLVRFVNAHTQATDGSPAGRGVLSPETVALLQRPEAMLLGRPHWGLGVRLYAPARSGGYVFGHDGGNAPAVNTALRIDPATGDAMIALSTGGNVFASRLASAWLRQRVEPADLTESGFNPLAALALLWGVRVWLGGGAMVICAAGAIALWRSRRSTAS